MSFKEFVRQGLVRKATKDNSLIKSLLKTSEEDLKFISKLELTEISARKIMANYYYVLRAVLEALALSKEYKIYSHEAFTSFLEFIGEKDIAKQFDRFRRIRNQINYYGKDISVEEVKENSEKILILIDKIKKRYFK